MSDPYDGDDMADFHDPELEEDEFECGRWMDGRLMAQCLKAGSEECDWDCPIGIEGRL